MELCVCLCVGRKPSLPTQLLIPFSLPTEDTVGEVWGVTGAWLCHAQGKLGWAGEHPGQQGRGSWDGSCWPRDVGGQDYASQGFPGPRRCLQRTKQERDMTLPTPCP